ncbi:hypothetical protein F5I97DRAFT_1803889 [Phlebopus sp. FC_14]|nr:hypothetical protein F5I97DRAFT_1803889 [Phlebopus sp. FC_14]
MPWHDGQFRPRESFLFSYLTSHKMLLYGVVSFVAVSATVMSALKRHSNFYSLAIHLSKSNRSVLILANFGLLVSLICAQWAQRIFFGPLRPQEVERLYDRLWFFVTESLLAFTIFRDDFDIPFALMFGFLLFVKSFHWLASDRIEWMDQQPYPGPPTLFHLRMTTLFFILWFIDLFMFVFAVDSTTKNGVGGMMMFASEYAILMAGAMNVTAKYLICVIDVRRAQGRGGENAPPWQNKSMWVFYVELVTDFLKLTTYLLFFLLIVAFYGLPLNIIRDVYITGRSFISRLRALIRYRAATRNMDERYADATEQEMSVMTDRTCIICREEMYVQGSSTAGATSDAQAPLDGPNTTPKKLPCGHIFHFHCLRSWLERQQSCPTCRQSVLENNLQDQLRQRQPAPLPPQPAPRPQNPFGIPAGVHVPQQGDNNPFGGVAGRFARNHVQPQQAPIQRPQGNQNATAQGWAPGPNPGVIIQYNIQYQGGQSQQRPAQSATPPSRNLQPVPPFSGFVGPDQNWRPWGMDPRLFNEELPRSTNDPGPSVSNDDRASQVPVASLPQESSQTPANAARQASQQPSDRLAAGSSNHPHSASSVSQDDSTTATWSVPSLIPLDLEPTESNSASSSRHDHHSSPTPSTHVPHAPETTPSQSRTDHARILRSISDNQLALMDQITREAIDERIRILEGVSSTVHHCVEDLIKVRSALPVPRSVASQSTRAGPTTSSLGAFFLGDGRPYLNFFLYIRCLPRQRRNSRDRTSRRSNTGRLTFERRRTVRR